NLGSSIALAMESGMQNTISSSIMFMLVMGCIWLPHRLCAFVYRKCYIFLDFRVGTSYDILE
ncbi:hypothetical protein, partial [Klebsiella aerogenes]|uniref:hypothetical protein n=1 Tax=Klebsiella aerogenes TaxID=548 RepID=UPI00195370EF